MNGFRNLSENDIDPDPFIQFGKWYRERLTSGISNPNAVSLGTSTPAGRVSVRIVLLKECDDRGFVFYTNYDSRKGSQLTANDRAALMFYWPETGRQIRIEGVSIKVSEEESEAYFQTRPRESQLSAWASEQSTVIPGRTYLERRYDSFEAIFAGKPVTKPEYWGGFRLIPTWFEFWQDGEFRLHDRLTYTKDENRWIIKRLAP